MGRAQKSENKEGTVFSQKLQLIQILVQFHCLPSAVIPDHLSVRNLEIKVSEIQQ